MAAQRDRQEPERVSPDPAHPSARPASGPTASSSRPRVVSVGLTGGTGAGKSTALAMFAEEGALVASADDMVHELYRRDDVVERLIERFGPDILGPSGALQRRRLAAQVRGAREELRWLEELTHPLVEAQMRRLIEEAAPGSVVVCEVPLLFESGFTPMFDLIVTIEAPPEQRLERSAERMHPGSFAEFEGLQAGSERRVRESDLAFCNEGDLEALRTFVRSAYARARSLLAEGR